MPAAKSTIDSYAAQFAALAQDFRGPASLIGAKREAFARFADFGFPTPRHEDWKYTSVAQIAGLTFHPSTRELNGQARDIAIAGIADCRLVFVNGRFAARLSFVTALPGGVIVTTLAEALRHDCDKLEPHLAQLARYDGCQTFVALNTALWQDGAFVYLPDHAVVEEPIHILNITTGDENPSVSYPRTLIIAGEGSQATIIESFTGFPGSVYFTNAVTEIVVGPESNMDHTRVQLESESAFHVATQHSHHARNSRCVSHNLAWGGALARHDINAVLAGRGIEATINGLYVANGKQHVDNHTAIYHDAPHGNSHELYKGIMDDAATAVFNGKIFVKQDAQKTDAKQTNQNLLISRDATINTKPQLQIYADDVRCTHGATVGRLSDDALFYLRSRGLARDEARSILTYAFASDVLARVNVLPLRERLERELDRKLRM